MPRRLWAGFICRKRMMTMNENENVRIDPESAYVKSMDYLDKVIAEAELTP